VRAEFILDRLNLQFCGGNHCNVVATSAGQIRHLEPSLSCTTSLVSCRAIRKAMSNLRYDARNMTQERGTALANR